MIIILIMISINNDINSNDDIINNVIVNKLEIECNENIKSA
jgi:hypothetical protein